MDKQKSLSSRLELVWWLATTLVVIGVLFPIHSTGPDFPFYLINALFIIVFITLARYIFLLKHTFLAYLQWFKIAVAVLCIPLFLYLFKELKRFQEVAGEIGLEEMFNHLPLVEQATMSNYVRSEMLFFGTGSIIVTALMIVRMVVSFWRTHNHGTT